MDDKANTIMKIKSSKLHIKIACIVLVSLRLISNGQSLSEKPVTAISLPSIVVPSKTITVSQALRFGEQADPRPETLVNRADLPVLKLSRPVMFDHDLLRWEIGFDKGDGYHKLRVRITNLADTPQSFELLYAPTLSRNNDTEISWRILAGQLIQPGKVYTDLQPLIIENNITQLVFLLRRRDMPKQNSAVVSYAQNPNAQYIIPAATAIKAELGSDPPKIIAQQAVSSAKNRPLILPAISHFKNTQRNRDLNNGMANPESHFQQDAFNLERNTDIPILLSEVSFELEGLLWDIKNTPTCIHETTRRSQQRIACSVKMVLTVKNLTNDTQSARLEFAIPEKGDGTVSGVWYEAFSVNGIYPGRMTSKEIASYSIYLTDNTQRQIPLRWLFRAYRQLSAKEQRERETRLNEMLRINPASQYEAMRTVYLDPATAYWKLLNDTSIISPAPKGVRMLDPENPSRIRRFPYAKSQ